MYIRYFIIFFLFTHIVSCSSDNNVPNTAIKASISDFKLANENYTYKGIILHSSDKAMLDVYSTIEKLCFSISIKINEPNTVVNIGREGSGYIELDGDSAFVFRLDASLKNYELHESAYVPLKADGYFNIECNKLNSHVLQYSVITEDTSYLFTYDKTLLTENQRRVAIGWGKPFIEVKSGSITVKDAIISSSYNLNSKLTIVGDSFVEGATMVNSGLGKRWCALLANDLGENNVPIIGKGGECINQTFIDRFINENSWFNTPYVLISLGTNNSDVEQYKISMLKLIKYLKNNNQIPVLVTVTPRPEYDYNTVTKVINDWVRSSGELYIDMHKAVTKPDSPNKWKDGYVQADGTHPTVKGHKAMYSQIRIDCPTITHL